MADFERAFVCDGYLTGAVSDNFVLRLRGQRHALFYCVFLASRSGWRRLSYTNIPLSLSRAEGLTGQPAMARRSGGVVDSAVT
jgi:hypothetical protein